MAAWRFARFGAVYEGKLMTAIDDKWAMLGGVAGILGAPTHLEVAAANGGAMRDFVHGSIYWHPITGAFDVTGHVRAWWSTLGAESSSLGYPMSDSTLTQDGVGAFNHFEHGSVFWSPTTGVHEVTGGIRERWAELRWEYGLLGYPTASPQDDGTHVVSSFQNGTITLTSATGEVRAKKLATPVSPNYSIPITPIGYRTMMALGRV